MKIRKHNMNLMRAISISPSSRGWVLSCLAVLVLNGCGKEEVRVYTAPKDQTVAATATATATNLTASSKGGHIHWTLPVGWVEKPASGMRVGSFSITAPDGQQADVSVIPLSGGAGSDLDNVNRWRDQIGLANVTKEALPSVTEKAEIGDASGLLVDMLGVEPQAKRPTRIVGAMLPVADTTWFFKMMGPDGLVDEQKPAFKLFLKSITFHAAEASQQVAATAPGKSASVSEAPASASDKPSWDIPTSWQAQPASSMLLARFAITDQELGKAEVTVSSFPGDVGGLLANVNRWRNQLGLAPVSEADLTKVTTPLDLNGVKATLVEIENKKNGTGPQSNRLIVAVVAREGHTWFFKMMGDDRVIVKEKAAFLKFVQSVRYPNA